MPARDWSATVVAAPASEATTVTVLPVWMAPTWDCPPFTVVEPDSVYVLA